MNSLLVTGGARSGKSRHAEAWCRAGPQPKAYLATARPNPDDAEMAQRIARHRADRAGDGWTTVEAGGGDLLALLPDHGTALIDCATLWLAGLAYDLAWDEAAILTEVDRLAAILAAPPCRLAVVTNEVGSGIVPDHALGRHFRDLQGRANQRLAAAASEVVLCVCGLPLTVKPCAI